MKGRLATSDSLFSFRARNCGAWNTSCTDRLQLVALESLKAALRLQKRRSKDEAKLDVCFFPLLFRFMLLLPRLPFRLGRSHA